MAILIDPPRPEAHGRRWSHLVSDSSLDELHEFAHAAGIPRRAFEGDHYDLPEAWWDRAVASGADPVDPGAPAREAVASRFGVATRERAGWLPSLEAHRAGGATHAFERPLATPP